MFRSNPERRSPGGGWAPADLLLTTGFSAALSAACGGGHHLGEYEFSSQTVAVVDYAAPAPDLWTGQYTRDGSDNTVQTLIGVGSRVALEAEIRRARSRLDSAARLVDVRELLSDRTLERATRYLGATPVPEPKAADYVMEIYIRSYGIDASGGRTARVVMEAEAVLVDRGSGHEIWNLDVDSYDRLTPYVEGDAIVPASAISAGVLATVTVDDLRRALASLTNFTADYITDELREDLRDLRSEG